MNLFPYQLEGVKALVQKTRFLLRDMPGLGKTCQLIKAADALKPMYVLVLCPKSMIFTWEKEIENWSNNAGAFHVYNHDRLITHMGKALLKVDWDIVIADESHMYLKNINTKRAKAFFEVIHTAKRVWLSTATVASKSSEDYWCTLKILLPDLMKKWTRAKFIRRFCNAVADDWSYSGVKYEGFRNMDELHKIFSVCSLRRTEEQVKLQLPELTETEMQISSVMYKNTEAEIEQVKQFVSGYAPLDETYQEAFRNSGLDKIPAVVELLETYPKEKKAVVFCWHREVANKLEKEAKKVEGRIVKCLTGAVTSAEERQKMIDSFQEGECNTLILNMQSGGAGITLTAATVGIYIQFPHSVIHWVQSRKRIHRIGSKKPVQIIKLISSQLDKDIFDVLNERANYIQEIEGEKEIRN